MAFQINLLSLGLQELSLDKLYEAIKKENLRIFIFKKSSQLEMSSPLKIILYVL